MQNFLRKGISAMLFANLGKLNTTVYEMHEMDTITSWYSSGLHCRTDFSKTA